MTYSNGNATAGFAANELDESEYPEPSEDDFYVGDINSNSSFALGGVPAFIGKYDFVFVALYNNFDDAATWGCDVIANLTGERHFVSSQDNHGHVVCSHARLL